MRLTLKGGSIPIMRHTILRFILLLTFIPILSACKVRGLEYLRVMASFLLGPRSWIELGYNTAGISVAMWGAARDPVRWI